MASVTTATDNSAKVEFPWDYFAFAFGSTWLILLPGILASYGVGHLSFPAIAFVVLAQFGASLSGLLLIYKKQGREGVKAILKQAIKIKIPLAWLVAIVFIPMFVAAASWIAAGRKVPSVLLSHPGIIVPSFISIFILQGPVAEEFGWRGYALPLMERRFGLMPAAFLLGVIWAAWHLPVFLIRGTFQSFVPIVAFIIGIVAASILIAWIYFGTQRNLFAATLTHATLNLSVAIFPPMELKPGASAIGYYYLALVAALVAVVVAYCGTKGVQKHAQ